MGIGGGYRYRRAVQRRSRRPAPGIHRPRITGGCTGDVRKYLNRHCKRRLKSSEYVSGNSMDDGAKIVVEKRSDSTTLLSSGYPVDRG
ncbi:hypothetical protein CSKR_203855 [Clonorchis sinensis]|uniref:Uncharacterized protein n=1 Tax=Clonorchis sinensis TaxID=79923 RepID=A0A8T1N2V0_CLOSI|nr:hypothetical protein CSKR_203855 [Clonorchis sinensis]